MRQWWHPVWYRFVMLVSLLWFFIFSRGKIKGLEYVKPELKNGFVLISNHVSFLDWMFLHALFFFILKERLPFLAKELLFRHSLWGPLMTESKSIQVSNVGNTIIGISQFKALRNSRFIGIFPEGTRSRSGIPGEAKTGGVKLAARLEKSIIPVALLGFYDTWPPHRKTPRIAQCKVEFLKPITIERAVAKDEEKARKITEEIMNNISSKVTLFQEKK